MKQKIASYFNNLLIKTLDIALIKFAQKGVGKGVESFLRDYIVSIMGTSILIIPSFRQKVLDCLQIEEDINGTIVKGLDWNIDREPQSKETAAQALFEWD